MRIRMKKAEREKFIRQRARELAASGEHHNCHTIEAVLRVREGFPEARAVLDNQLLREELDLACQRVTGKPAYGGDFVKPSWERPLPWHRSDP